MFLAVAQPPRELAFVNVAVDKNPDVVALPTVALPDSIDHVELESVTPSFLHTRDQSKEKFLDSPFLNTAFVAIRYFLVIPVIVVLRLNGGLIPLATKLASRWKYLVFLALNVTAEYGRYAAAPFEPRSG